MHSDINSGMAGSKGDGTSCTSSNACHNSNMAVSTVEPHSAGEASHGWKQGKWLHNHIAASPSTSAAAAAASSGVAGMGAATPPPDTFRRLRHVLETYTDVTRYPRCGSIWPTLASRATLRLSCVGFGSVLSTNATVRVVCVMPSQVLGLW